MGAFVELAHRSNRGRDRKHLPIAASSLEVFVCSRMHGIRLTRTSCGKAWTKESQNGSSVTPCRNCRVGRSHAHGKIPIAWDDGAEIEVRKIEVGERD